MALDERERDARVADVRDRMRLAEPYDEAPYVADEDSRVIVAALRDITRALLANTEATLLLAEMAPSARPGTFGLIDRDDDEEPS